MAKRSIDKALREDREIRKISIDDLAQRSGIAKTVIDEIEAGNHDPSDEERVVLSRALGTPLPGVSGEVLENPDRGAAIIRMAEQYAEGADKSFIKEIKEITKRLKKVTPTDCYQIKMLEIDPKKLKSELRKMKKAITELESLFDVK